MSCALLKECVAICQGKIATEASGNIDLENIAAIAETGVDFASVGKLTHSAGNVDLSMQCDFES
jgi:nicotinate-nucleotide pyrophosphorylase (carboxylating)